VPYPAVNAKTAKFNITSSRKNELLAQVLLTARKGSGVKALAFNLGVDRIGGRWVVNYWLPEPTIKTQANPYNN
jgi:hypothetical protein